MANTTATIVANLRHGAQVANVFHKFGRPISGIESLAVPIATNQGFAPSTVALLGGANDGGSPAYPGYPFGFGTYGSALIGSYSEEGAAATAVAMPTPSSVAFTPGYKVAAVSPTNEAVDAVAPDTLDLLSYHEEELVYGHRAFIAYDGTSGLLQKFNDGEIVGTTAVDLTPSVLIDAHNTLCELVGANVDAVCWLSNKQMADLMNHGIQTSAAYFGTVSRNNMIEALLDYNGVPSNAYVFSWGKIHICVDPAPLGLLISGGDVFGGMFVPWLQGFNGNPLPNDVAGRFADIASKMPGGKPLAPAFGLAYREDFALASARAAASVKEIEMLGGLKLKVLTRLYAGQGLATEDVWGNYSTVTVHSNACVGIRSAA